MKKALKRIGNVYHLVDGRRVEGKHEGLYGDVTGLTGNVTGLYGDVTGLRGDVTGLYGDVTGLRGDVDEYSLTQKERTTGVTVFRLDAARQQRSNYDYQ